MILPPLNDLIARLGDELDFDVARSIDVAHGTVDVVWFDRSLPLAAVTAEPLDLRDAPVLPVVAFIALTATELEASELATITTCMEDTGAPLRILVIGRNSRPGALAPALQSVDQLRKRDEESALRARIASSLREEAKPHGRTIVMLQGELVEWARRLREARPRSYSAESLFNRTGAID